jgi:hypothetical protein
MTFTYDGIEYRVDVGANKIYQNDRFIRLPDGRYLKVGYWLESYPPIPQNLSEVESSGVDDLDSVAAATRA